MTDHTARRVGLRRGGRCVLYAAALVLMLCVSSCADTLSALDARDAMSGLELPTASGGKTDAGNGSAGEGKETAPEGEPASGTEGAGDGSGILKVTPTEEELKALLDPEGEAGESETAGQSAGEDAYHVFQGRAIPISAEAEMRKFQPGDFRWEGDRMRYVGTEYEASFGIDVSAYHNRERADGKLDWEAARRDGVEFAMIRVGYRGTTEGALYEDPYYAQNLDGAHAAGIVTGAYLYSQAVTAAEALEEAAFLLERLEGHTVDGPVCYDWEVQDRSSRAWNVSAETATECALAFCGKIAEAGYLPVIYQSKYVGYMKYDQARLEPYLRWYPQYPDPKAQQPYPDFLYQMDLWQFSDRCTVEGIGKRTDGNLWLRAKDGA